MKKNPDKISAEFAQGNTEEPIIPGLLDCDINTLDPEKGYVRVKNFKIAHVLAKMAEIEKNVVTMSDEELSSILPEEYRKPEPSGLTADEFLQKMKDFCKEHGYKIVISKDNFEENREVWIEGGEAADGGKEVFNKLEDELGKNGERFEFQCNDAPRLINHIKEFKAQCYMDKMLSSHKNQDGNTLH